MRLLARPAELPRAAFVVRCACAMCLCGEAEAGRETAVRKRGDRARFFCFSAVRSWRGRLGRYTNKTRTRFGAHILAANGRERTERRTTPLRVLSLR
jgi:hypothetical protein